MEEDPVKNIEPMQGVRRGSVGARGSDPPKSVLTFLVVVVVGGLRARSARDFYVFIQTLKSLISHACC